MASTDKDLNGSFGYDFEDKQTRLQLELMDELQKLGVSKYIDLPQLVVVGDQSTGKSSVLQAITEIPFPIDDKMCTRFATEVVLKRTLPDHPTSIEVSIIPAPDEPPERKKTLVAWQPEGFDQTGTLNKEAMKSVFKQAERIILGDTMKQNSMAPGRRTNRLSTSILRITRSGPKETNFVIVDVPGLVRGNETNTEHQTAKCLVKNYLDNLRSIVVVVIDVIDLERHEIFQMLKRLPDQESRVIGVINKCDTKQKQSHDWVFDLIRNNDPSHERYLKEGWYGLRNRQASELSISDRERDKIEEEFFLGGEWKFLDSAKLGRHHLKNALIKMRNRHVKRIIPDLVSEIQIKLDECTTRLSQLGEPRITNPAQFALINKIATKYSRISVGALEGHYELLSDDKLFVRRLVRRSLKDFEEAMTENGLQEPFRTCSADADVISNSPEHEWAEKLMAIPTYSWIRSSIETYRAKEDPDEVNPLVKAKLWKEQTVSWKEIASENLARIEQKVFDVNEALFKAACPDNALRTKLQNWLYEDFMKASEDARDELRRLIENEMQSSLFTLHPAKRERKQWYHDARVKAITAKLKVAHPETSLPQAAQPATKVSHISADVVVNSIIYGNAELVGILNTHDSLAAYYDIALYRFIDNFALQVVERHLLGPRGPLRLFTSEYATQKLYGIKHEAELNELAGEDPAIAQERTDLETKKASLEGSRKRVQNFKVL